MIQVNHDAKYSYQGKTILVTETIYSRGGLHSPDLTIITWNGRRLGPYAVRRMGISCTFNQLFHNHYGNILKRLVASGDGILKLIKPDKQAGSLYHQPVVLGIEHGLTFEKVIKSKKGKK